MRHIALFSVLACIAFSIPLFDIFPQWLDALSLLSGSGSQDRLLKLGPDEYRLASELDKLALKRRTRDLST